MPDQDVSIRITAADYTADSVFVSFNNGMTITYHAPFLFSVREQDSNSVIATEPDRPRPEGHEPTEENFR